MPNSEMRERARKWLQNRVGDEWELESLEYMADFATLERAEARREAIIEAIDLVEDTPLGYVTERDHEVLERFADHLAVLLRTKLAAPEKEETRWITHNGERICKCGVGENSHAGEGHTFVPDYVAAAPSGEQKEGER